MSQRPQKSLRTILMLWFLLFSIVPLAFITGYSVKKYESAIDQELSKRLLGNGREIEVIVSDFETNLLNEVRSHAVDKSLVYHLSTNNMSQARQLVRRWLGSPFVNRIWVYSRDGRLEVALHRNSEGEIVREASLEASNVYLNTQDRDEWSAIDVLVSRSELRPRESGGRLELSFYSAVKSSTGRVVGYIEEVISIDSYLMNSLKNRLNLEIFFYAPGKDRVVSSHPDLAEYRTTFFDGHMTQEGDEPSFFELNVRDTPYRFMLQTLEWGGEPFVLGIGASKSAARSVLKNVNYAFFTVAGAVIVFLVILSFVMSKVLLKPLYEVLEALQRADVGKEAIQLPTNNDTELGLLAGSFNEMSQRVFESQQSLQEKIKELEKANIEIRETQAKLVHTAKMASVGQLVAGVAHELNNPIGFIYSNMSHLKDYTDKLIQIVQAADNGPQSLQRVKKTTDFDYIVEDMPRLIQSCEDGARRTRDIVLGLRNFSRLEEAQSKEVDIHEGIENTLQLLTGELKNRIEVHKDFAKLPMVMCYPSQLNQVFMNILSNAAQAIEGEGEIFITTRMKGEDKVEISMRDTGKGMSKETAEKIFDPFFTTKSLGQGTGLGLSISYGVIQKHGGDIQVRSQVGEGTEFIITLPINHTPS